MPRLFSPEDADALLKVLYDRFGARLRDETFEVRGAVEPGFVEATLELGRTDGTSCYRMDFQVSLAANRLSEEEGRALLVDFIGFYLDQFFEGGREPLLPLDFHAYPFAGHVVHGRGDVTSPLLDSMADEIIERGERLADDDPRRKTRARG